MSKMTNPVTFQPKSVKELKKHLEKQIGSRHFVLEYFSHDWKPMFEEEEYCRVRLDNLGLKNFKKIKQKSFGKLGTGEKEKESREAKSRRKYLEKEARKERKEEEKREKTRRRSLDAATRDKRKGIKIDTASNIDERLTTPAPAPPPASRVEIISRDPVIKLEHFSNWAGTQRIQTVKAAYPITIDHLRKVIQLAKKESRRVRCAGRKHSWSPMFADEGDYLVYVHKLESDYTAGRKIRIVEENIEEKFCKIDVMAGVPLGDLKEFQLLSKINLPCNVILTVVQLVGVLAMGCHGVGWDCKSPCDQIVKMRITNSEGVLVTYSVKEHGEEMMKAVKANIGMFGIIYDVTLQVAYQDIVKTENRYYTVGDILYDPVRLKKLVEDNFSVELFWFPFNSFTGSYDPQIDEIWARIINKTPAGKAPDLADADFYNKHDLLDNLTERVLKEITPYITGHESLTPYAQIASFICLKQIYKPEPIYQELPQAIHYRSHIEKAPVYDMEFAFDYKGNYNVICSAVKKVADIITKKAKKSKYPLNVALEMRFMAHSEAFMCPASIFDTSQEDPHVVYIEVLSLVGTDGWFEFCQEVANEWQKLGGIPHLAKQWSFLNDIDNYMREKFGDNMVRFKEQLKKSNADPNGLFLNARLEKLFYPENTG